MFFIEFLALNLMQWPAIKQRPILFGFYILVCGLFHFLICGSYVTLAFNFPAEVAFGSWEMIFFSLFLLQGLIVTLVGRRLMRKRR